MAPRMSPEQVPEVENFLHAQERLEHLRQQYPQVFQELQAIAEEYNARLEEADKAVRGKQISCGPFDLYQTQTTYDAEKLFEEMGRENFLKVGGSLKTVTEYTVDKGRVDAAIAANIIPQEVVKIFTKTTPKFHKPDKISI